MVEKEGEKDGEGSADVLAGCSPFGATPFDGRWAFSSVLVRSCREGQHDAAEVIIVVVVVVVVDDNVDDAEEEEAEEVPWMGKGSGAAVVWIVVAAEGDVVDASPSEDEAEAEMGWRPLGPPPPPSSSSSPLPPPRVVVVVVVMVAEVCPPHGDGKSTIFTPDLSPIEPPTQRLVPPPLSAAWASSSSPVRSAASLPPPPRGGGMWGEGAVGCRRSSPSPVPAVRVSMKNGMEGSGASAGSRRETSPRAEGAQDFACRGAGVGGMVRCRQT